MARDATVTVEGDEVVITGEQLQSDRSARLYFQSILGGQRIDNGWRGPRRRRSIQDLVVQINGFLERKGWIVERLGQADEAVEREIARRRSFQRTREQATRFWDGEQVIDIPSVLASLTAFGWEEGSRALRQHQIAGLCHALSAVNSANFSVPGSGKTATSLAVAAAHLASGTIDLIVVIGPLSCFRPWQTEATAVLPGKLRSVRVRGSISQRHAMYASATPRDLLLLSYATAATDRRAIIEICQRFRVMLVVDESHRIKRFRGGYWAPAIADIARYARVRIILSGTPMPQSGRDLFSQLKILWPGQELTGPPDTFAARVNSNLPAQLADIRPFVSRTPKSALGLAPYQVVRHTVPITGTQAEIYDLIEANFRRRVQGLDNYRDKIDALRRGRPIRLIQAATNPDLLNSADRSLALPPLDLTSMTLMERLRRYRQVEIPAKSQKGLEIISGIAQEWGKVVVWSNFLQNLDQFSELVRLRLGLPCFQVDGRVPVGDDTTDDSELSPYYAELTDTREQRIAEFLSYEGPAVLVANPASCSESISLHSTCHNAIYLDRTYDCALFLQSIDRIHRLGLPAGVTVQVHIIQASFETRQTIDQLVDASIDGKETRMRLLLEGAELRPLDLSEDTTVEAEGSDDDLAQLLRFLLGETAPAP